MENVGRNIICTYFKIWLKALEMISARAGIAAKQITTIITDYAFIVMLKNKYRFI